ncbi:MAG: YtxH domain-containing protein, partial [Gemmatimonadetes bacterium]|nr:YtxH domain-containing protein [Gemmatimonadota bacterium]
MTEHSDTPVVIVERRSSSLGAFIGGTILGAVVALLYAPRTGEETQAEIRDRVKRLRDEAEDRLHLMRDDVEGRYKRVRDDVEDRVERVRGDLTDRVDTAREDLKSRKLQAEEVVKVGRSTARKAREDLERRVAESKEEYK